MKCLVTGGAGFIGHHLVRALLARGDSVRVLDDFSTGKRENLRELGDRVDLIEGDLRCAETVSRSVEGVEVVFHHAARVSVPESVRDPVEHTLVNVHGTVQVLDAARRGGVRRVVFASSAAVYGDGEALPKREDMTPAPVSPYGASKLTGEVYCRMFAQQYGLETVCLRYFNVFGQGQDPESAYAAAVPAFIAALMNGRRVTVYGDGEQSRDFVYVDNVVRANLLAAEATCVGGGEVVNVAGGRGMRLNEMLRHLEASAGVRAEVTYGPPRPGDVRHSTADIGKARRLLGYEPTISAEEGLDRSVAWYRRRAGC